MSFAPNGVRCLGSFVEKDYSHLFEFSVNDHDFAWAPQEDFPHLVWVGPGYEVQPRYARVLKTVAYVVVNEDEFGRPVIEKWSIKKNRSYSQ